MEKFSDIVVVGQYVRTLEQSIIYGAASNRNATLDARRITRNGLKMLGSITEATPVFGQVVREGVGVLDQAFYAKFDMEFLPVRDRNGIASFVEAAGPFIVVARFKTKDLLLGEKVPGITLPYTDGLSDFEKNGLKPVKDFAQVMDAIKPITEKGIPVDVASVSFKRVG